MIEQLYLLPTIESPIVEGETLQEQFERFHKANPTVYAALVKLARQAKAKGRKRMGIGMLFEILRWHYAMQTNDDDFKLNNNYRSRYVRLIEAREPDLVGLFQKRQLLTE